MNRSIPSPTHDSNSPNDEACCSRPGADVVGHRRHMRDPMSCALDSVQGAAAASRRRRPVTCSRCSGTGDRNQELRMRFALVQGTPTIHELAVRRAGGTCWGVMAADAIPDYRVVSGLRRMSNQQMAPLRGPRGRAHQRDRRQYRWDPFWDAPLDLSAAVRPRRQPAAGSRRRQSAGPAAESRRR